MGRRQALIERREHRGFTQESLAHAMGVSTGTIAAWEQGIRRPKAKHRVALAHHLEVTLVQLDQLLEVETPAINGHEVPGWLSHYDSLIAGAGWHREVEFIVIPGLLQTPEYAAEIERTLGFDGPERAARVELRLTRQQVLYREPTPLEVTVIMPERVLYEVLGGTEVMAAQLEHLLKLIELDNVDIRLLPADGRGAIAANGFSLLGRAGETQPFLAVLPGVDQPHYIELAGAVQLYVDRWDRLLSAALTAEESARRIRHILETHYQ